MAEGDKTKCAECRRSFVQSKGPVRRFCRVCRPSRNQPKLKVLDVPIGGVATVGALAGECERTVRKELTDAKREETVPGVLAIRLSRMLDGVDLTGPQAASLAKQVQVLVLAALSGATPPEDFVDELTRRRMERAEQASAE